VTYFVRSDHIGRPAFATDVTGAIVWSASYKPFGEVDASTGVPMNLRFPGQWFSAESNLYQNWMRDYDPTTDRYIEADPLGLVDGASVYGYAQQSPNRYVDPRGEFVCGGFCIAALVIGAAILTPDAANAPGFHQEVCGLEGDELVPPDPAAPFINGALAGIGEGTAVGRAGIANWLNTGRYWRLGWSRKGGRRVYRFYSKLTGKTDFFDGGPL